MRSRSDSKPPVTLCWILVVLIFSAAALAPTARAGADPAKATGLASGGQDGLRGPVDVTPKFRILSAPDVMLLASDDDILGVSPIQTLLQAYGDLGLVDVADASAVTPTLAELQAYDVVVTWSNYMYANPVILGDRLADYVDAGGKVIDLNFAIHPSWGYQGRFRSGGYSAMNAGGNYEFTLCLGVFDPDHPVMTGVTDVCDFYRASGTSLTAGSSSIAQWSDGELFVAVKDDRSVVTIGGYVGYYSQWTGDMADVLHNAILWLADVEPTFTLNVTVVGNGTVTRNPDQPRYQLDDEVTLTAEPDPGWEFEGWSGDLVSTENPVDVTITGNLEITATFALIQTATVTVEVGPGGGGTVSGGGVFNVGDMATVTATPAPGWVFQHWLVNSTQIATNPYTFQVTGDITLTAIFAQRQVEAIPTTGTAGLVLLLALLAGAGVIVLRRA